MPKAPTLDLHVHSTYSDGSLDPEDLAARAARNGVTALAITDHDTMAGSARKLAACRRHGLEGVVGVELSCELAGREVHILSLFADPDTACAGQIAEMSQSRKSRMIAMLEKLAGLGMAVDLADLTVSAEGVYGRPHLARALVKRGFVKTISEAFGRYLYDGGPIHIPKRRLRVAEGIDLAQRIGGVAILAHPGVSGLLGDLEELRAMGLDGIEVHHPKHGGETVARLLRYCRDNGLLPSGGSDFHSPGDGPDVGAPGVPLDLLEPLRGRAGERKGR
ncbi:MAG: PHP domain-containing protein [Planctomycetes bacterium]|nr:PHP domain-containing protein [Planctomycetota bacterium]